METGSAMISSRLFLRKWGGSMKKSFLIALSNIRKSKSQMAAIAALIMFAALMLNLWLILSMDYKQNFDYYHDKLNAEHVTMILDGQDGKKREFITDSLEKDERTTQYSIDDVMSTGGSFSYNGGELNSNFLILEKEAALHRSVGRVEITEESRYTRGIYLPMLYSADPEIAIGQTITITMGNSKLCYPICGFFNSTMTGSHNSGITALILTEDLYEELERQGTVRKSTLVSVRMNDKAQSEEFEAALLEKVSAQYPGEQPIANSYTMVSTSRYISQMICSGIVSAMAFFVLLIALITIASNVTNYIQQNMKNLGVLKAVGYQSRQIIFTFLLQFLGITLIAALMGIGLSYCLFPAVNTMMIAQTGIPYYVHFLLAPFVLTLFGIGGAVAAVVWMAARRIKKIEPIVALRQGVQTHNFKNNHVPLEKTGMPLNLALAMKTTLSGIKQNIIVSLTMLMLSLILAFSGLMLENVIVDVRPFVDMVMGETADCVIIINMEIENEFLQRMKQDSRVEKIYLWDYNSVRHVEGSILAATICEDFSKVNNPDMIIAGRFPKYDNEVAIAAKYAREKKLRLGDEIVLNVDGKEEKYIISGFTQLSNNLGKDCLVTRSGYERMGKLQNATYSMNLAEEVDMDSFLAEAGEYFGQNIYRAADYISAINSFSKVYIQLMTVIVIAILILSIIIISFVLYLLVRTMLNNKRRDYGIMKALGFTTGQLILQTAVSFMPAVVLATLVGLTVSCIIINPLTAIFLSGIGIVKCNFSLPMGIIAAAGMGMVLFSFAVACLLSLKIKKIAPQTLLVGE